MSRIDGAVTVMAGVPLWVFSGPHRPVDFDGARVATVTLPTGLLFPSLAALPTVAFAAGQGHDILGAFGVLRHDSGATHILGPDVLGMAVGANPLAVKAEGGGFKVALVRSPLTVELLFVSPGGDVTSLGFRGIPETSQGITGWEGDTLLMADPPARTIAGRALSEVSKVGPWWIGQNRGSGDRIVLVDEETGFAWTAYETRVGQRPRGVLLPDGRLAITASDEVAVRLVMAVPSVSDDTIGRDGGSTPPPPPPPPPPPDEDEMTEALLETLTAQLRTVVDMMAQAYPHLLRENTDASCGEFTHKVVSYLHREAHPAWGHVKKVPGQTQHRGHAVDAVMYADPKQVWDILGNAGATDGTPAQPKADPVGHGNQGWLDPDDVEGGTPPPAQECAGCAELRTALAGLQRRFAALIDAVGRDMPVAPSLHARVQTLEARPPAALPTRVRLKGSTTSTGSSILRHAHGVDGVFDLEAAE